MTETTVETTEAVETEAVETPEVVERVSTGDPMRDAILDSIADLTEQANASAAKIGAATTDRTKIVHDILTDENTDDEKIRKFQTWKESVLAKLEEEESKAREYAATLVPSSDLDVDAEKVTHKTLADKVKTAIKFYVTTLPGTSEEDLKGIPALKTLRGGTASSGQGGKRPRVQRISYRLNATDNWTEVSKQQKNAKGEEVTVTNFTVLASTLGSVCKAKVEVKDLQAAAFDAAGTDDLNSLDGKVFEFATTVGEQNVFVQVQPKSDSDE